MPKHQLLSRRDKGCNHRAGGGERKRKRKGKSSTYISCLAGAAKGEGMALAAESTEVRLCSILVSRSSPIMSSNKQCR